MIRPLILLISASALAQVNVATYRNDNMRTAQNLSESTLTPANVRMATFGKLFTFPVDGRVDAQPLIVSGLNVGGQSGRNVVFTATEHDSVYAFDAVTGATYWHVSMLKNGESSSDDRGCGQVTPEIGVTATPVIDVNAGPHGTIYIAAMSKDAGGGYHQRMHALDLTTGAELLGGPVDVQATFPGTGDNSSNGNVVFDPKQYKERAGLAIVNGVVYTSWASHCDIRPYTGWTMGYSQSNLAQTSVFNFTPNGNEAAIWGAGGGLAADPAGNLFYDLGNGTFDTTLTAAGFPNRGDLGNSFVKLALVNGVLTAQDYWTMFNTVSESNADEDLGSGGVMLLPDVTDASNNVRHLGVGAGKDRNVYVFDRDNMGKYDPSNDSTLYQDLAGALGNGEFGSPAWFNGTVYFGAEGDVIRAFPVTAARLAATPASTTATSFTYPGSSPSVSANGAANGILWAVENSNPAVLHAYDATNLATELYNSNQAGSGRDQFGNGNKFMTPTIANGEVFVGTPNSVAVFGLLGPTLTSINPAAGTQGASVGVTLTGTNFTASSTVAVSGAGVTAGNVNVVSAVQITATLTIAAGATAGADNVTVTTPAGTSNSVTFTVNAGSVPPTLTSIVPNSGAPGTAVNVTLTGTNLAGGTVTIAGAAGVAVSNVSAANGQITATFTIAAGAAAGARNVTVSTSGGASNAVAFTVGAGGSGLPTFSSISPNTAAQNTVVNVTLTGTNFVAGASIAAPGIAISNVRVVNATQITASFRIGFSTQLGPINVTVKTPSGVSNSVPFTATYGPFPPGWQLEFQPESLPATPSGAALQRLSYAGFPDGVGVLLAATQSGNSVSFTVNFPKPASYDLKVNTQTTPANGMFQMAVNGANAGPVIDEYSAGTGARVFDLGTITIPSAGNYTLTFTVTGKNAASSGYAISFDYFLLTVH